MGLGAARGRPGGHGYFRRQVIPIVDLTNDPRRYEAGLGKTLGNGGSIIRSCQETLNTEIGITSRPSDQLNLSVGFDQAQPFHQRLDPMSIVL